MSLQIILAMVKSMSASVIAGVKSLSEDNEVVALFISATLRKEALNLLRIATTSFYFQMYNLFSAVEPEIDFLLLIGDNESSGECEGGTWDRKDSDPVQTIWREYFITEEFAGLDKSSPPWGKPSFRWQEDYPENFFMHYNDLNLAFFGITEPDGEDAYNQNADFIEAKLRSLVSKPDTVIIFRHAALETRGNLNHVLEVLDDYSDIPMLYVMGNDHYYNMDFAAPERLPKLLKVTVKTYEAEPLLISIIDVDGHKYFYVESTDYSC